MKNRKWLKKGVYCVSIVIVELLLYFGISKHIANVKTEEAKRLRVDKVFTSENEFLRTIDCATIFDAYPEQSFMIEFGICAEKAGAIIVYQQNGVKHRYSFEEKIDVTEEFKEFCLIVDPTLTDAEEEKSYLSFYGEYGSGVIPTVRDISITLVE